MSGHMVTTYYLETCRRPSTLLEQTVEFSITVKRMAPEDARTCQRMYIGVGGGYQWKSRLLWNDGDWSDHLRRPDIQFWVGFDNAREIGYFEIEVKADHSVEITYFGVLQQFIGKGFGGPLLRCSIQKGWATGADRIWLKTSSTDHPNALRNYIKQGMNIVKREEKPMRQIERPEALSSKEWKAEVKGVLHNNPWFSVLLQSVERPDGSRSPHYTIYHDRPAVGIVVRDNDRFLLIRQHRFIINEFVWAIPSGGMEAEELPMEAAMRELKEETGYVCERLVSLIGYFPTYGCSNQRFELFLADAPILSSDGFDRNEVIETKWFERSDLLEMIMKNKIVDGLSLVPLLQVLLADCTSSLKMQSKG